MNRHHYNQLRTHLKDSFKKSSNTKYGYSVVDGIGNWVVHSGLKPNPEYTKIIIHIFGTVPYPYCQKDRTKILNYLHQNRYGTFYKTLINL